MGLEAPAPGSSVFQARFELAFHVTGNFERLSIPIPPGPRNCSQSSARAMIGATLNETESSRTNIDLNFMMSSIAACLRIADTPVRSVGHQHNKPERNYRRALAERLDWPAIVLTAVATRVGKELNSDRWSSPLGANTTRLHYNSPV